METALKGFISHLRDEELNISTQQVAYAAVRSFFETHYMPLRMRRTDYPSGESLGHRAATRKNIRRLLKGMSNRLKAIILFIKDSGLRISDVASLKYGDVTKELEVGSEFVGISMVTRKERIPAYMKAYNSLPPHISDPSHPRGYNGAEEEAGLGHGQATGISRG